jgi:uncharacterized hydrophobic protein (TIGR00271 family)
MQAVFEVPVERRGAIYDSVLESSRPDAEYLSMVALSSLIALLGLLQNSVAVIIGAMLISPLMNPVLAAGLALILGDGNLGRKSAKVLGVSVAGAVLFTALVAWLVPLKQATPEILARTSPNLLDLAIAFLSGLAGTLALRSGTAGLTIIPGVAIAVAVMPPLATVGYGLSTRQGAIAGGAFLLFVTNLVSILISAALVFLLFGFRPHEEAEKGHLKLKYRLAISALVLTVLSVPLLQTLRRAVGQARLRSDVARVLERAFHTEHSSVADMTYSQRGQSLLVRATLRTTEYFDSSAIAAAETSMRERFGSDAKLDVEQILVTQGGLSAEQAARIRNFISSGVIQPATPAPEAAFDFKATQKNMLVRLERMMDELLASQPLQRAGPLGAQLSPDQPMVLVLQLASPEPLEAQTINLLAGQLAVKASVPVLLHGQVELGGPTYRLAVENPDTHQGLSAEEGRAISKLVELAAGRADLRLRVRFAGGVPAPLLRRRIEILLERSRLKPAQWTIAAAPEAGLPAPPEGKSAAPAPEASLPSSTVRCEFRVYQEF